MVIAEKPKDLKEEGLEKLEAVLKQSKTFTKSLSA